MPRSTPQPAPSDAALGSTDQAVPNEAQPDAPRTLDDKPREAAPGSDD